MTVQITATVTGAKLVRRGLEALRREIPRISRKRLYDVLIKVRKIMRRYPPPPPGSTYARTYKLRRNWKVIRVGNRGYRLQNRARSRGKGYAAYVVGNARGQMQANVHAGRWPLVSWVIEKELGKMPRQAEAHIKRYSKSVGF